MSEMSKALPGGRSGTARRWGRALHEWHPAYLGSSLDHRYLSGGQYLVLSREQTWQEHIGQDIPAVSGLAFWKPRTILHHSPLRPTALNGGIQLLAGSCICGDRMGRIAEQRRGLRMSAAGGRPGSVAQHVTTVATIVCVDGLL
jgi:hypothetical protein